MQFAGEASTLSISNVQGPSAIRISKQHTQLLSLEANSKKNPMAKFVVKKSTLPMEDGLFTAKRRKVIPHEFVLEALDSLSPRTNPMFGCVAVYVGEKIVLILRDKPERTADNGVWLATTHEHHESLKREFPNMRSIRMLGKKVTGWQVLPADAPDFEEAAMRACELIVGGDQRIGKVPRAKKKSRKRKAGSSR
jgi:hypothetical protein